MLAEILSNKQISEGVYDLRLDLGEAAKAARPGQFLHIRCSSYLLRRPISICGADSGGIVRLVYAVKGSGTLWLSRLGAGRTLDVLGPLGNGFPTEDRPTLLVAGGLGAPPMLFCSSRLTNSHAVLGFRNKDAAFMTDEFGSVTVVSDDGSIGKQGYPHDAVGEILAKDGRFERVFACGPEKMLRAVASVCAAAGVSCWVSLEERMGCGVGACLVCACAAGGSYKRVCKDGPVFNAEEVDWDG